MSPLAAALVQSKVATQAEMERALARQALYGADLATSLIEVTTVNETTLIQVVAEALRLEATPPGALPVASESSLAALPRDVVARLGVFPLDLNAEALVLAVSEPLSTNALDEIARLVRLSVSQRYAPALRVRQALSRDYGLPLERRQQRALAKLEGHADPSPSAAPPASAELALLSIMPTAPSMAPLEVPEIEPGPQRMPASSRPPAQRKSPTQPGVAPPSRPPAAPQQPAVHQPAIAAMGGKFQLPALAMRKGTLQGFPSMEPATPQPSITSQGPGTGARAQSVTPKSVAAVGSAASRSLRPKRHRGPYTAALAEEDLRGASSTSEVLAAFFDFAAQYFEYSALFAVHGDIAEGREASGPGLGRVGITAIGVPLDIESSLSRARDQNNFLLQRLATDGLDHSLAVDLQRANDARVLILPVSVRGRSVLLLYGDAGKEDVELAEVGDVLSIAPLVASALERILAQRRRAKSVSERPMSIAPPARLRPRFTAPTAEQRAQALASALDLAALDPNQSIPRTPAPPPPGGSVLPRRLTPHVSSTLQPTRTTEPAQAWQPAHPTPVVPGNRTPVVPSPAPNPKLTKPLLLLSDAPGRRPLGEVVEDDWEIPDDPMPANVRNSSLRPPRRTSAPQETVNTEPGSALQRQQAEADALLSQLLAGDTSVEDQLIALGVTATARVIAQFPGPILQPSSRTQPASESGPILRLLAHMGEAATPFVVARTGDGDPQIRMWATLLLAELPYATSIEAICRRLLDEDPDVARAALRSAGELSKHPESRTPTAEALCALLQSSQLSDDDRFGVLRALVELKLEAAVPRLLRMLGGDPSVAQPAQWALRGLTCQDFGPDPGPWESWWQDNAEKSRVEWLVQALAHPTVELKQTAFSELREVAQHDFGYRENLPPGQVQEVQRRFLEWWKTSGRIRSN